MIPKQVSSKIIWKIWTDGSVQPTNPGEHGGWATIISTIDGDQLRARSGYVPGRTTNQRMEIHAALAALEVITEPSEIIIVTDSRYVERSIQTMRRRRRVPIANSDLWELMRPHVDKHIIHLQHVMAHRDDMMNNWADALAYNAAHEFCGADESYTSLPVKFPRRKKHAPVP
jgi:ribonuclease HI